MKTMDFVSLVLGIVGFLVFGIGMSMTLAMNRMVPRLVTSLIGIVMLLGLACMALAYPLYARMVKKERARVALEILRLSRELLK